MKMNKITGAASIVALLAAVPSLTFAQSAAPEAAASVEEVVVTGSRIQGGFQAPTPVTVVGAAEIQKAMTPSIADYLNQMPSFGAPTGSSNPGPGVAGAGLSLLNLRDLGSGRTLVMLDKRRVPNSSTGGGVDTNTLPTTLVQRVEVVTGGASAAWGADALAGVVNFVLNRNYEGFEVSVQGGVTERRDNTNEKIDITYGRKFAGGKGSIIAAGTISNSPEIIRTSDRDWWERWAVVNNPTYTAANGQPRQVWAITSLVDSTTGGLIVNGPLRGTQFIGPTGVPARYDFGYTSTTLQVGGTRTLNTALHRNLTNSLKYGNFYLRGQYDVTDNILAYAEMSYGKSRVRSDSIFYNRNSNITVRTDNAFIPASIRAQILAGYPTGSFTMSRLNVEAGAPGGINDRELLRGVVGLVGKLADWNWGAYYQYGEVNVSNKTFANGLVPRYNAAIDAVRNAAGQIVCRTNLTGGNPACIPFNIFGEGAATPEAVNYIFGTTPYQNTKLQQQFVSVEASGPVFDLPAGKVTAAIGADASSEEATSEQDADSVARNYVTGNPQPFDGKVNFREVFGELNVPIIRDVPLLKHLEFNAAGRITDYSTSGTVYTWKLGLSNNITDELRLRVTRSRDIKAPSLSSLFSRGQAGTQTVFDPSDLPTALFDGASKLHAESVIEIEGKVRVRPEGTRNAKILSGEVEVQVQSMTVLNPSAPG